MKLKFLQNRKDLQPVIQPAVIKRQHDAPAGQVTAPVKGFHLCGGDGFPACFSKPLHLRPERLRGERDQAGLCADMVIH
ncbi:Uncharacterised protein [Escherichia coli]|nr:Uncharacterised protein [Escherichia coli]